MVEHPSIGMRVKIHVEGPAGNTSHQGVVLPGAAEDHLTIKLVNGYNISYPLEMVTSIEELEDVQSSTTNPIEISQDQTLPKVTIIHTGGTIASRLIMLLALLSLGLSRKSYSQVFLKF